MYAKLTEERRELYQWDTGQYIEVSDDVDRIDFQFPNTRRNVYGVFSENGRVPIPDVVLQDNGILDCLIMVDKDGVYTIERMEITIIERPMPPGYVMTDRGQIVTYDDLDSIIGKFDLMRRTGDTMAGDIDMDGYMITNLDDAEEPGDAVSKHFADSEYVKLTGSRMKGRITGLQWPIADDEPSTKAYADQMLPKAGGTMTGRLSVLNPTESGDAANKGYVDTARKFFHNVTVPVSAFVEDETYEDYGYKADIALTGVTASMIPEVVFPVSDLGVAPVCESYDGGVRIWADDVPEEAITIPTIILWRGDDT